VRGGPYSFFINLLFSQSRIHFSKSVVTHHWRPPGNTSLLVKGIVRPPHKRNK
jgi:hypothetical protein